MNTSIAIAILLIYSVSIFILFFYSLAQLNLLFNYIFNKKKINSNDLFDFSNSSQIPKVTIQLPIYNEKYVVERLLENIVLLDYPKDKLEIQVLDDSTDESVLLTKNLVDNYKKQGIDIVHITRQIRTGYKAGALKEGLETVKGDFIAIFDADFLPQKDWLYQTIPHFKNENVGVVQTRWGHTNREYSVLTKIQAFALDAHFTLEQTGRNSKQHCINFNGTAGVWRKSCIVDAGNWEADTLTEDLDLSYRAQLRKWKFIYLEDVVTPAELPMVLSAMRSQQFRWNKGGAENLRRLAVKVSFSNFLSLKSKLHGLFHLSNSSMFLYVFIMAILSVPMIYIKNQYRFLELYFDVMLFFVLTTVIFFTCYWYSYQKVIGGGFKNFIKFIGLFFTFYTIVMGFSYHNSVAVLEGLFGKKSAFIRTPKFNMEALNNNWSENVYLNKNISKSTIIEAMLLLYFGFGLFLGFTMGDYTNIPFHLMLTLGYSFVFFKSFQK